MLAASLRSGRRCGDPTADADMDIIVGRALNRQTPVFVEEMRSIVCRPYWNVPPSIARGEVVPALRRDPDYRRRQDMEIVSGPGDRAQPVPLSAGAPAIHFTLERSPARKAVLDGSSGTTERALSCGPDFVEAAQFTAGRSRTRALSISASPGWRITRTPSVSPETTSAY
jgi:hypothetical protein